MGIVGLSYLIDDASPHAITKDNSLKDYLGKKIALDAFQFLYRSLAPRKSYAREISNKEDTSPLVRTFYTCMNFLENGIKPLFVFDGKPPSLKSTIIKERSVKREKAITELQIAEKKGEHVKVENLKPQVVQLKRKDVKDCRGLLKLMGIPYFYAPGEAEAQCAVFVEKGLVYASGTYDMDALTYGTKVILRNLPSYGCFKFPIHEIHLEKVLIGLQLSLPQFVDLSILMGCDYCQGISGLGAHRAIELIHRYNNIENILDNAHKNNLSIPSNWLYKEAREQFSNPHVVCDTIPEFRWNRPDIEGIVKYLSDEPQFFEKKIRKCFEKLPDIVKC